MSPELYWLPLIDDFGDRLRRLRTMAPEAAWPEFVALANARAGFVGASAMDKVFRAVFAEGKPAGIAAETVRVALLTSSTGDHLLPSLRLALIRSGYWPELYLPAYGQHRQELLDPGSGLRRFQPDVILFALDAPGLISSPNGMCSNDEAGAIVDRMMSGIAGMWQAAADTGARQLIQQTVLNTFLPSLGLNEQRMPGSRFALARELNAMLRTRAGEANVDLLDLDIVTAEDGLAAWHDRGIWNHAKQEIKPQSAAVWADYAIRLVRAKRGRSRKCLVLDLDNTLWGGVIGDDGVEGIALGQGSAQGEAFQAFQTYARDLSRRGIILAVCSKNDEKNALAPFERHPEMVLLRTDVACFVANWEDKPANLRRIAREINIGTDALVFVDDNPFERAIVRREMPEVAVPELPEDPALYARCVADAGYFEALAITPDDIERTRQYQANAERESLRTSSTTDMAGYLASLNMTLRWSAFDSIGIPRATQLVNKTNQFNLTTRRYAESEVIAISEDPATITLQCRLLDSFGDNGMIAVVIAKPTDRARELRIDTWLMSCRVLGRKVEEATLEVLVELCREQGVDRLLGEYLPTGKNGMVREHYERLGFAPVSSEADGASIWALDLNSFRPTPVPITLIRM